VWAEPDLGFAADAMIRLSENFKDYLSMVENAHRTIAVGHSPKALGKRYVERLLEIEVFLN
jgi:hypothetical protein